MSKKNKAKFKRQIKQQALQEITKTSANTPVESAPSVLESPTKKFENREKQPISEIQNLPQIKADLKKTGIVVACLAIVILALVLLDQKNHLLLTFGDWLFRILHIQ